MSFDPENTWLIMYHDDDYHEPEGIFTGNIFDILINVFGHETDDRSPDHYLEAFSFAELIRTANLRIEEAKRSGDERKTFINIQGIDECTPDSSTIAAKQLKEYLKKNKSTNIVLRSNGFNVNDRKKKINQELSELSEDTLKYLRENGFNG